MSDTTVKTAPDATSFMDRISQFMIPAALFTLVAVATAIQPSFLTANNV